MDVHLPQEDIEYVHAASFYDALTYIPFTPLDAHLGSAHPTWSRFTFILITHSRLSSLTSGNPPIALWTRLPLCVLFFSFYLFFRRPISLLGFSCAGSRRALYVRGLRLISRHPTPQMRLQLSYVSSLIIPRISSPLVHPSSLPRCPHQLSATRRPPTLMQVLFI